MINVTDTAKRTLKRILADNVDWPGARLRLMDRGNGKLGLGVDIEAEGDEVVHYDGLPVLIVAPDLAANLKQVSLDYRLPSGGKDEAEVRQNPPFPKRPEESNSP